MQSASAAFSRGLTKSRTALWDFYISGAPAGKDDERDQSPEQLQAQYGRAGVIFYRGVLLRLISSELTPRRLHREGTKARPRTLTQYGDHEVSFVKTQRFPGEICGGLARENESLTGAQNLSIWLFLCGVLDIGDILASSRGLDALRQ